MCINSFSPPRPQKSAVARVRFWTFNLEVCFYGLDLEPSRGDKSFSNTLHDALIFYFFNKDKQHFSTHILLQEYNKNKIFKNKNVTKYFC